MIWRTSSTGSADTERLGELLGSRLGGGEVIELRSDLGGGKTTFVRGLAKGAGSQARVSSPTFTLSRIYQAKGLQIHHFDFYRLTDPGILASQLAEAVQDQNVVVVEWADIVKDVLADDRLTIEFKPTASSPDERDINFYYPENLLPLIAYLETNYNEVKS
ncbi:MAG TPA: tRNA (adenosine(37)-N6)-threonylcarbamoyltransferase complex ATPase subunit type 1 TsaE [Candidatus Saccharimonadales bacterium]|nr:tRNA (adenosine(37)-N6)-threonylcarbamoyltransferase complex ATPase subunit type 1 TsaE [Candidatus Saccharimonadales bacterium]